MDYTISEMIEDSNLNIDYFNEFQIMFEDFQRSYQSEQKFTVLSKIVQSDLPF